MLNPTGNVVREIALPRTFFAIIATNATSGVIPFTVNATVNAIGGTPPYQFTWDFGDGTPQATGNTVAHTYQTPGTYILKVSALDTYGNQTTSAVYLIANAIASTLSISGISIAESNSNFVKDANVNLQQQQPSITSDNLSISNEKVIAAQQPAPSNFASESMRITSESISLSQQQPSNTSENVSISKESISFKNS
jgi:PKD repeat protein